MKGVAITLLSALPFLVLGNAEIASANATIQAVSDNGTITVSLSNYKENDVFKQQLNLAPSSTATITVENVPSNFWFIVLQIHTFQYNATLSYDKNFLDKVSNRSLFGTNIGLYLNTRNTTTPIQVFLKHDNVLNLDALLVVVPYGQNAPIPGGCNMEFEIEVAPYQKLHTQNEMIMVDAQPASVLNPNGLSMPCEKNLVQHKMYRVYLPRQDFSQESYFQTIENMLIARDIVQNGAEIPPALSTSSMRRVYSAYTGTGSVYAVVATYGNYSSAYVPTFTYACSPLLYPESCVILNDTFSKVICAIVLFIGCFSIIMGNKYALVDRLLPSCVMGGFIGYTFAAGCHGTIPINLLIGLIFAIFAAFISVYLYSRMKEKPLYAVLYNLPFGLLCGCIAYLYASAGMFYLLENNWLFWPTFLSLMLIMVVLLTMMLYVGEIITCTVFGSYFFIIALDYYFGSNLKYILITLIRRITVPGFHLAFVYPPHQGLDVAFITIWILIIIIRLLCITLCRTHSKEEETQSLLPDPILHDNNYNSNHQYDRDYNYNSNHRYYRFSRTSRRNYSRSRRQW